jgi:hypothetical protein
MLTFGLTVIRAVVLLVSSMFSSEVEEFDLRIDELELLRLWDEEDDVTVAD